MTIYGPETQAEQQADVASAAASAAARTAELSILSQMVKNELTVAAGNVAQQETQSIQSKMESASKEIYDWGYQVFDGLTGKAASGASDKLRDLSVIKGFDSATLSIKFKD